MILSGIGVVVVIAVLVFAKRGGEPAVAGSGGDGDRPAASAPEGPSRRPSVPSVAASSPRAGKPPAEPAPLLTAETLAEAERHYEAAKAKWNEAQRLRSAGETARFGEKLKEAYRDVEALEATIDACSQWYLTADIEGWAMPAEYVAFARRLDVWDKLSGKIQKLKPY